MNSRRATFVGWLLLVAAATVYLSAALRIDADLSAFLPRGQSEAQRMFSRELRDGVTSRLLLVELAGDTSANLARISQTLQRGLAANPEFKYVGNGAAVFGGAELSLIRGPSIPAERCGRYDPLQRTRAPRGAAGAPGGPRRWGRHSRKALAGE